MSRRSKFTPSAKAGTEVTPCYRDATPQEIVGRRGLRLSAIALVIAGLAWQAQAASAPLPTGGQVVSGTGSVAASAKGLLITQKSDRLALDWQQFSIGAGHSVEFVQPSRASVAVNRVLGTEVSTIQGALKANGLVFLLNPNGVWFTPSAQVNVGSLVASTLSLQAEDIASGRYVLSGRSQASVINQGSISTAQGGAVALLAAKVVNEGQIHAPGGRVALGAGSKITLDLGGPALLQVSNDELETLISNGGAIRAEGGQVWLNSQAANALTQSVINHSGVIEAQALQGGEGGQVLLLAQGGTLNLSGSIQAQGSEVETSGLHFNATAGASVLAKKWLIDPVNVDIDATLASSITTALSSGNVSIATTGSCTGVTCTGSGSDGNITLSSPVSWSSNRTLTLQADNNIAVNAALTHTGTSAGGIVFLYGQAAADGGASAYTASAAVTSPSVQWRKGSNPASLRYAIFDGNYFLGNQFMELGICGPTSTACSGSSSGGKFGTTNKPSLFFGRSSGAGIGMVGDADGFGSGVDLRIDYFLPGSPAEQFTAGYAISGAAASALNFANTGNSPVFGFLPVGTNHTITLKYSAVLNSKLKVEQQVSLEGGSKYFNLDVALTNVSSGNLDNVQFARSFDPDNSVDKDGGGGYTTVNKIEQTLAAGDGANVVSASSQPSGAYYTAAGSTAKIVYYSANADSKPGYGSVFFSGSSLSGMTTAANALSKGNSQTADAGIGMLFTAGTMTPGQSKSYSLRASLDNRNISDILGDLGGGGTPVTSVNYALGSLAGTHVYKGSAYNLSEQWSATSIFGSSYSAWVPGTDYVFVFNGSTVTGFTNAGSYTNLGVNILRSGFQVAASGNTAGTFTIAPAPLTITASSKTKVYDGQAFSGGNGASYSGFVNGETSAVLSGSLGFAGSSQGAVNAGSYVLNPQGLSSSNYAITLVPGTLTVDPRPITVQAEAKSKVYGDVDPALTWSLSSGSLIGSDTLSGALSRSPGANVGNYTIDASALANGNYLVTAQNGLLTISPRPITVQAEAKSKVYGDADPGLTWSLSSGSLIGSDTLSGALSRSPGANVGNYTIDASALANGNYLVTAQNGLLTISPRPITVQAEAKSKVYGDADPALTWALSSGSLIGSDTLNGALSRSPGANVGNYTIDASALANGNYLVTAQNGLLTISPRPITVQADAKNKTYGDVDPALTWALTQGSLLGGDRLAGVLSRLPGETVGNYSIDASKLSNGNYLITAVDGNLLISPRAQSAFSGLVLQPSAPIAAVSSGVVFVPDVTSPVSRRLLSVAVQNLDLSAAQRSLVQVVPEFAGSSVRTPSLTELADQSRIVGERLSQTTGANLP